MAALLKSKLLIGAAIVAALVGLYALLGFKVAPRIVRGKAIEYVREQYGRDLTLGEIRIHPFKLQLEVRDAVFPDADGERMLAFERLFVDFDLSSLWKRAFYFREVDVESPYVRAVIRQDGSMNFADLAPRAPPVEEEEEDEPPTVWIAGLAVDRGTVDFLDRARRRPFERRFQPVTFALQDFKTTPEGGDFRLSARSQADEQFDWKGRFALAPVVTSDGEFTIADLRAPGVGEFLGDALNYKLSSGSIDLGGRYRLALGPTTELDLTLPAIELDGLALRARGVEEDWIKIPKVVVSDTAVAIPAHTVGIGRVAVTGLSAQAWMDKDGSINLQRLFAGSTPAGDVGAPDQEAVSTAPPAKAANAGPAAPPAAKATGAAPVTPPAARSVSGVPTDTNTPQPASSAENNWTVKLGAIELESASIELEDRSMTPATKFELAPVQAKLENLSLDQARPVPVSLSASLDGSTAIKASGTLTPEPFSAELDVELDELDLRKFQPYVGQATDLTIRRGKARAAGKFSISPPGGKDPEVAFGGDLRVSGFRSIDDALKEDFINFERLDVRKLQFAMAPDSLSIDRATLRKPYARVSISPDQVLNVAAVFDPEGTAAALAERKAEAQATEDSTPRRKAKRARKAEKEKPAPPPREVLVETGWPIRIREVRIESGQMNFSDQFIQPNFAADIKNLNGSFTGLSTDPNSSATVDLKGDVGEFSPVTIAGSVQLFAFDRHTDVGLKFENIHLPVFNPYSGRFAGYDIAKGSLTTDLKYQIEDRKLDAQHHIRIDQLEWGEATESKEAVPVPIKLATSLLKDVDGVIDLDVPVKGTLDDPKFRIGPIVWQIIKNILVKAVTAPFRLLGSLFKGAEEAQFVQFAPGDAALDPAVAERMAALAKGLAQKKEIKLDIPIGAVEELDRPALLERALTAEVDSASREVLRIRSDDEAAPPLAGLEPKQQQAVLSAVVEKLTGAAPQLPEPPPRPEGTSRADAKAISQSAAIESLDEQARAAIVVDPRELERLGQARGEAIQTALLASGELEAERVFLTRNDKVTAQSGKVRFELGIK
jgi:uncharacterized protein involved in outer membrane biogenesis